MNKIILMTSVTIMTLGSISESRADIKTPTDCNECQPDIPYCSSSFSTNCQWSITDDGVLIIKGNGINTSYIGGYPTGGLPWQNYKDKIEAVVFDNINGNGGYETWSMLNDQESKFYIENILLINDASVGNLDRAQACTENDINACLVEKGLSTNCGNGKYYQEKACVPSCGTSFRLNDGECDRVRYTPAEAAQYLKDTDNEIIMTFKVNR